MRNFWPLLLVVAALFVWNRSCNQPTELARSGAPVAGSVPGGPVRQLEHEPSDMMERERALPQAGGLSARTMLDSVQQGLQHGDR